MLGRLLTRPAGRLIPCEAGCSRSLVSQVHEATSSRTNGSVVDDASGSYRPSKPFKPIRPRDLIPHDPRKAARVGNVGYGEGTSGLSSTSKRSGRSGYQNKKQDSRASMKNDRGQVIRTANPFILGPRIATIYQKFGKEAAIEELEKSKREARTVAVSNMLIKMLLKDGQVELAYKVWMDMKRIGLVPTPMSYTVFFSSVDPKQLRGKLGERITTIWKQWQTYCEKASDPEDPTYALAQTDEYKVTSIPTNAYLAMLHKSGTQDTAQISSTLDDILKIKGFAPTKETFSIFFLSITHLLESAPEAEKTTRAKECYELCSKAWNLLYESAANPANKIDGRAVSTAAVLYRQLYGIVPSLFLQEDKRTLLQQLEQLLGLEDAETAGAQEEGVAKTSVKADSNVIYDAMVLASLFEGRYSRHVLEWYTRLKRAQPNMLDARISEYYMRAAPKQALQTLISMLRTPSAAVRPTISTYTSAMAASPFIDQIRILAHMSGRNDILESSEIPLLQTQISDMPEDGGKPSKRALEKGYHTKHIAPDAKMMVILLQTALDLQDWRRIDRALRVLNIFGFMTTDPEQASQSQSGKTKVYSSRLKDTVMQACGKLLENAAIPATRKQQLQVWQQGQNVSTMQPRLSRRGFGTERRR